MTATVLVIGGYGVFGGRLARRLIAAGHDVLVAGRSAANARAFCAAHGGAPLVIDVNDAGLTDAVAALGPGIVIDAAGPFQGYAASTYRVASAAIACGAHYLDLSDDARFTAGIGELDEAARDAGVGVLSGVSSVPALSSAVAASLVEGASTVELLESIIAPGNRAPRGLSVMAAILGQVGQPLRLWRGGGWRDHTGWSGLQRRELATPDGRSLGRRWTSFIGAPDLALFVSAFGARSVLFRASLELGAMHLALSLLSGLVRMRWLTQLESWTPWLHRVATKLDTLGTDRGGMQVRAVVADAAGTLTERRWTLLVAAGEGPEISAIPAELLVSKLAAGVVEPGARACICEFSHTEAENALAVLSVFTQRGESPAPTVFQRVLGADFAKLSPLLRRLHCVVDAQHWAGQAEVTRGTSPLSRLVGGLFGFPGAGEHIPVSVEQCTTTEGERWVRRFGAGRFVSHLSCRSTAAGHRLNERFGPFRFEIGLRLDGAGLRYPVTRGWCLGIPIPGALLPRSDTTETSNDAAGTTGFDVSLTLPFGGLLVRYRGWLMPA